MPMKDNERKNQPEMPGQENAGTGSEGQEVSYTPEQRRLLCDGLRIWARVAIRSYMRQQAGESQTATDPVEVEEG